MAGHSKWSKVKHIKGPLDVKREAVFSRLVKEITLAARLGGGDPAGNIRPRAAVGAAKAGNMPTDNIARAIKNGTGELAGGYLEEITCGGYAPGGVAMIVEKATDNKNRTAADIRGSFAKRHVSLATAGSVSYMFHQKGQFAVPHAVGVTGERLLGPTLDAGAEDITDDEDYLILTSPPDRFYAVGEALRAGGVAPETQRLTFVPDLTVPVTDGALAGQILRLYGALEDFDDAQNVYLNFDIPGEIASRPQG